MTLLGSNMELAARTIVVKRTDGGIGRGEVVSYYSNDIRAVTDIRRVGVAQR